MTTHGDRDEDYAFVGENPGSCQMILDHNVDWCGDCYACANCGLKFVPISSVHTAEEKAMERVKKIKLYDSRKNDPAFHSGFIEGKFAALQAIREGKEV